MIEALARRGEQLIALGEEILAQAGRLSINGDVRETTEPATRNRSLLKGQTPEAMAHTLYTGRRIRDELFSADLFGEPSWDILLDLFIAGRQGRKLQVSTVCIGAQVPSTTALRYIRLLEERGFIAREFDPRDSRRIFLRLTPLGTQRMTSLFEMVDAVQSKGNRSISKLRLASGGASQTSS